MVRRKLHDERSRLTGERLEFLQNNTRNNDGRHSYKIRGDRDKRRLSEQGSRYQTDNRKLCSARYECRRHDRHLAVAIIFNCTRCHDARNAAACRYEDRYKTLAGQAELAENSVHDKCNTRHVTDILNDGQKQEQNKHLRNKSENGSHTADNTVLNQTIQPGLRCNMESTENRVKKTGDPLTEDDIICKIRSLRTYRYSPTAHGYRINQEHHNAEDRKTEYSVRNDFIDLV